MELIQLQAFLEAAALGSFRRAAAALNTSQPSVSARIQALEAEMGVPLFHRTARGVRTHEHSPDTHRGTSIGPGR